MLIFVKKFLNKSFKSWTVWAGLVTVILTSIPDLVTSFIPFLTAVSAPAAAKATALIMLITRLRTIVLPILEDLKK